MPAEPAVYRGLNMTLEELRTKDDEELMRLNMDGSITDNEYFLATEAYRDLYLAWLHGRQPTDETAKEFKPVCDSPEKALPDWPGLNQDY